MSPFCQQETGLSDEQYWAGLSEKIAAQRIPFSGSLALTHRCNLACVHCYAKADPGLAPAMELSAGQWKKIIDEIKAAGCLYLLLTGGEPLLRADFSEIYRHAKKNGFLVTVFTNGTLVSERIIALFRELPPRLVEISLYGAGAATHDRITGVPGSFEKAMQGIETLAAHGIPVRLKSVLMTLNNDEFPAIEEMARSLGLPFRLDPALFPSLAGDRSPLDLRVSPERAVAVEMANPERKKEWREFRRVFGETKGGDGLYNCGSGVNTFHVDPQGWLYPCLMVRHVWYPLGQGSFQEGWSRAFNDFRREPPDDDMPCRRCEQKLLCGYCPGFFAMEHDGKAIPSDYLCAIGKLRFATIASDPVGK
jgi:radical SAM protein with 4Fe4S-binding SPASM domain